MSDSLLFIDGEFRPGLEGRSFDNINPATGQRIGLVAEARAAVRVASPPGPGGRLLPTAVRLGEADAGLARWALVGLGARGLLYHALVAAHLAEALLADAPDRVPREFGHASLLCDADDPGSRKRD